MKLIPAGDLESASPVMPVRWCLEPKDVATLHERNTDTNSAYVVFVIVDDRGRETRQLAPMTQMMEYLEFYHPGVHHVFAKVMEDWEAHSIKKRVLEKQREHSYANELLDYEKKEFLGAWISAEIEVVVPKEHFPKEPPAWLRRVVEWGFAYPSVDQCQFRRRFLLSIPKLFFAGIWAVITTPIRALLALVGTILTLRNINYGAVIRPWRFDIDDVFARAELSNSWLFHGKPKGNGWRAPWRSGWLVLLYPPVWFAACIIVGIVAINYHVGFIAAVLLILKEIWRAFWWSRWIIGVLALLILADLLIHSIRKKNLATRDHEADRQERERRRQEREERARRDREALVGLLTCSTGPMVVQLQAIPPERRTFHLQYHHIKAKVCRPFAR
jgi:heme exporter protein D